MRHRQGGNTRHRGTSTGQLAGRGLDSSRCWRGAKRGPRGAPPLPAHCRGLTQAAPLPRLCGHGGFSPPLAGEDLRQRLNRLCWPLEGAHGEWCGVKHRALAVLGFRFGFLVRPLTRRHACLTISLLGWHYH